MSVQLFGVGEAALHRLFSPLVNAIAPWFQPVCVDPFFTALPHTVGYDLGGVAAAGALLSQGHCKHKVACEWYWR